MRRRTALWVGSGAGVLLVFAAGCAGGDDRICNADADCASAICNPDGTCEPPADAGPGDGGGGGGDTGPGADGGPAHDAPSADSGGDAGAVGCAPNHDGVIERLEVPLRAGLRATFRATTGATVSTAGEPLTGGMRRWDFSTALPGDHDVLIELAPLDGQWFAADFPGASYWSRLSEREELLGVFELGASEILLRGVVSPEAGLTRTSVEHDPPVTVLHFPLQMGARWSTNATVSGLSLGFFATWTERYEQEVDARGELLTPFGTFPVLRVRITLTRVVGLLTTVVRSFAFVSECFGTVATVVSDDNESRVEFTSAAEIRRLAP